MKQLAKEQIQIHWWNFKKKTLDFTGTISECLKSKGIKYSIIKNKRLADCEAFRFKFELSGRFITFEIHNPTFSDAAIEAIQLFLTVLGDKSLITGYRYRKINF